MNNNGTFLPDFCKPISTLYLTLVSQLLAIVLALHSAFYLGDFWQTLSLNALFIFWVAFSCAAVFCLAKRPINNQTPFIIGVITFLVINLSTALTTWVSHSLLPDLGLFFEPASGHINPYIKNIGISSVFALILLRFLFLQHERERQTIAQAEAQLDALQARIRPHFLFNSLNTIASLTRRNPKLAETLTENLSELFRAHLHSSKRLIPFAQEIDFIDQYLDIEKTRLGDRLTLQMDLSQIPEDALIPPLTLQPLIENAVYHGIEPMEKGGCLTISAKIERKNIQIVLSNPVPIDNPANDRQGHQIAIDNIRLRLKNCYGDQGQLTQSISEQVYRTQLRFPYKTNES